MNLVFEPMLEGRLYSSICAQLSHRYCGISHSPYSCAVRTGEKITLSSKEDHLSEAVRALTGQEYCMNLRHQQRYVFTSNASLTNARNQQDDLSNKSVIDINVEKA